MPIEQEMISHQDLRSDVDGQSIGGIEPLKIVSPPMTSGGLN